MSNKFETEIIIDPKVPLVRIIRDFGAEPERVFQAHTDPELLVRWNGPRDTTMSIDYFDCRSGGSYRYKLARGGDFEAWFNGTYHEIRPNQLIVQTFTFEGVPDGVALEKMRFERIGAGHTRLTGTSLVDSFEDRDAFVATGMETGVREGYERLDDVLAGA